MEAELLVLLAAVAAASWGATGLVRRYALHQDLLDRPNARSSHLSPTPRGGGLAIVLAFIAGLLALAVLDQIPTGLVWALLPAAVAVAAVGLWDDHDHVHPALRLLVHLLAAVWMLSWLAADYVLPDALAGLAGASALITWAGLAVAVVWCVNLFNFMDGIDGIAATQSAFVGVSGAVIASLLADHGLAAAFLLLATSSVGFLLWNWPPAKIFMGDVGSGFLGLVIAALLLMGILSSGRVWPWLILPAIFVSDATITLIRRMSRGDRWYEAHRSHAYQWSARRWGHRRVTVGSLLLNLLIVLPGALAVWFWPRYGAVLTVAVYACLVSVAVALGAGRAERQR